MAPHAEFSPPNHSASSGHHPLSRRLYSKSDVPEVSALAALCNRTTDRAICPHAAEISKNIPIYNLSDAQLSSIPALQDEWYHVLLEGPGVFVLQNFYANTAVISETNEAFERIIAREKATSSTLAKGDHFASGGKNDRIWNSFSKHCIEDPTSFVTYYTNPWLQGVCEAWLGPGYRVTAQANIVRPGGAPQTSHRDYHLGFQTAEQCARFPRKMQVASQLLTLQGAVAHVDMPLKSGPTMFLPFSQMLEEGYMAYRIPEFAKYFESHYVALPLKMGDAVFFNPALFHAAGANKTVDVHRSANLLQVSSAFGKPMESIDTIALVKHCWDEARQRFNGEERLQELEALIKALGDGYAFPTNLDRRPPAPSGQAPETEQDILMGAFLDDWSTESLVSTLEQIKEDSQA